MKSETQYTLYKFLPVHSQMLKSNMATTIYEYVSLVILCPLALMIYLLLNYFWPDTAVPALALPVTLFLFLGLTFLFITPRQYLTTVGLTLELTGVTVFGLLKDVAELRKCPSPLLFHL